MTTRSKDKPTVVSADRFDDTNTIGNVAQMYEKLVKPIDTQYRSVANAPGLGTQSETTRQTEEGLCGPDEKSAQRYLSGQAVDPNNFPESRCHAFYRMLGLPVVSQDGFYNAGHDPNRGATQTNRSTVNDSLSSKNQDLLTLVGKREQDALDRRRVFSRQDEVATGYALLLRNPKRFFVAETGQTPFYVDKQKQPVSGRKEDIEGFKTNDGVKASLKASAESPSHIIKPFIVIPAIEEAVQPGYKRRICVPFLKDIASTKTTPDITLKRPVIEYIIRQRLKSTERDDLFIKTADRLINNSASADATSTNIRNTLLAISGQESLATNSQEILDGIQGFTTIQAATATLFVKGIQTAVKELSENIRSYNEIITTQRLQPVPNTSGPEFGGTVRTVGGFDEKSKEDQKIATMELTRLLAQLRSQEESDQIGNESVFATAISADLTKTFDKSIKKLKAERDKKGARAINNLKVIEIVTGEISGFGLVDILAMYTALWTISIGDLLGLLDDNSIERLRTNFPDLAPPGSEADLQLQSRTRDTIKVLSNLEKRVFNILTYADSVFEKQKQGPRRARKGTP